MTRVSTAPLTKTIDTLSSGGMSYFIQRTEGQEEPKLGKEYYKLLRTPEHTCPQANIKSWAIILEEIAQGKIHPTIDDLRALYLTPLVLKKTPNILPWTIAVAALTAMVVEQAVGNRPPPEKGVDPYTRFLTNYRLGNPATPREAVAAALVVLYRDATSPVKAQAFFWLVAATAGAVGPFTRADETDASVARYFRVLAAPDAEPSDSDPTTEAFRLLRDVLSAPAPPPAKIQPVPPPADVAVRAWAFGTPSRPALGALARTALVVGGGVLFAIGCWLGWSGRADTRPFRQQTDSIRERLGIPADGRSG